MSHTPVRCEHDGIHWYPRSTVEKYSPDQSSWALAKLDEERSWKRWPLINRLGVNLPQRRWGRTDPGFLHGDWLREIFREPEDGYARTEGNILVTTGLQNLGYLLIGTAASGANGRPLVVVAGVIGGAICGVSIDTSATAAAVGDTRLNISGSEGANTWYRPFDPTYPTLSGTGVAAGGQLNGQCTFGSGEANYAWNEWCWASCTSGTITAGTTLASVASNVAMLNHWTGTTLGTKGSGATWVFSTTLTFSL
jgi:hypothetical protein